MCLQKSLVLLCVSFFACKAIAQNADSLIVDWLYGSDFSSVNEFCLDTDTICILKYTNQNAFSVGGRTFKTMSWDEAWALSQRKSIKVIRIEHLEYLGATMSYSVAIGTLGPIRKRKEVKLIELFSYFEVKVEFNTQEKTYRVDVLDLKK